MGENLHGHLCAWSDLEVQPANARRLVQLAIAHVTEGWRTNKAVVLKQKNFKLEWGEEWSEVGVRLS